MNVNQKIEEALSPLIKKIWPMYCPEDPKPDLYAVYNSELDEVGLFGDDQDEEWVHHMQVHLFTKKDYMEIRSQIRERLRAAGFTMTNIATFYESDTEYYHLCFECWIEE